MTFRSYLALSSNQNIDMKMHTISSDVLHLPTTLQLQNYAFHSIAVILWFDLCAAVSFNVFFSFIKLACVAAY